MTLAMAAMRFKGYQSMTFTEMSKQNTGWSSMPELDSVRIRTDTCSGGSAEELLSGGSKGVTSFFLRRYILPAAYGLGTYKMPHVSKTFPSR